MLRRYTSIALLVTLLLSGVTAVAQVPQEKIDQDAINKIKEEGMNRSQVMEILSYLTDVYGPRLTNSPQMKAAQGWAKNKLASWGLQNAHLEPWGPFGRGWTLEGFTANIVKPNFYPIIAYPKAWSPSTNGVLRGQVVLLDAKTQEDLDKYKGKLKGAIVMISPAREVKALFDAPGKRLSNDELLRLADADPAGGGLGRRFELSPEMRAAQELNTKKWMMAQAEGAGVVLEPGRGDGGTIFVQSVNIPTATDTPFDQRPRPWTKDAKIIPQAVVSVEHYNRIARMIQKGAPVELEIGISARYTDQDMNENNVIAEIPGTDLKDEVVMLGAHFDSWHGGTGATDNGAGSAVMMEAMRILQTLGLKPRRTIRIGLWSGEEQGLLGSRAYVEAHFGKASRQQFGGPPTAAPAAGQPATPPTVELKPDQQKISAYFNIDNGTGKIRGIYLQGNEQVRPIFRQWFAPFKDLLGTTKENSYATISISNTGGTDHLSFDAVGIPGFQFIQDPIEYDTRTHHSNQDVYDRIQEDDMKQMAVIVAAFVYNTAMRDQKLPRKPLPGQTTPQPAR